MYYIYGYLFQSFRQVQIYGEDWSQQTEKEASVLTTTVLGEPLLKFGFMDLNRCNLLCLWVQYLNYLYLGGQLCGLSGIDSSLLNTVWSVSFLPIGKWKCRSCKLPVTGTWVHWCQWKQLMYLLNKLYIGFWCKHNKHKHNNQTKAPVTSSSLHETACWRLLQHGATTLSTEHFDVGFTCTTASTPTRPPRLTRTIEDRWLRRRVHVITANKQQQAV